MKLLTVFVSIVAAIAANNGRNFIDGLPEELTQAQPLKEIDMSAADDPKVQNKISEEEIVSYNWNSATQRVEEKSCEDAGGICMPKKKILKCNANIEKKLKCDNKKQVCCISEHNQCVAEIGGNSKLWDQIQSQGMLLEDTINEGNDNITSDVDRKFDSLESKIDYLNDKLESIIEMLNNSSEHQDSTTTPTPATTSASTTTQAECPDGFFMVDGSSQCYIFYNDEKRYWRDVNSKCTSEGYRMAEPNNPVQLREFLVNEYGFTDYTWLGAKANGSAMIWQHSNTELPSSSSYWNYYSSRSGYVLFLLTTEYFLNSFPESPYYANSDSLQMYTLCEV